MYAIKFTVRTCSLTNCCLELDQCLKSWHLLARLQTLSINFNWPINVCLTSAIYFSVSTSLTVNPKCCEPILFFNNVQTVSRLISIKLSYWHPASAVRSDFWYLSATSATPVAAHAYHNDRHY